MSITRRTVLTNSSKLALGLATGMPSAQEMPGIQPAEKSSGGKFRILVCGGHPGDPETAAVERLPGSRRTGTTCRFSISIKATGPPLRLRSGWPKPKKHAKF